MNIYKLEDFTRGWFIGDFSPSILRTQDVEVAVQKFSKGEKEREHYHRIAREITLIISGRAVMFDKVIETGEIVEVLPGESTGFEALEDCITLVVKHPGAINDKYLV